jgi:hypothetical protein
LQFLFKQHPIGFNHFNLKDGERKTDRENEKKGKSNHAMQQLLTIPSYKIGNFAKNATFAVSKLRS